MVKKQVDEGEIFRKHHDQILAHVRDDPFAQWLGIRLTTFDAGFAEATLLIQSHMLNAHNTVHGAVIYALADHVFSVACNAYGKVSVGISTTVQFMAAAQLGDEILARAQEIKRSYRTGFYRIDIYHKKNLIATMDAICHRKDSYFVNLDE